MAKSYEGYSSGIDVDRAGAENVAGDYGVYVQVAQDNTAAILEAIDKALVAALEKIGLSAEGDAKELCPVDTGRLRNSITHQVEEGDKAVYVGTNVEYAVYVEMNDKAKHKTGQAYFLRDAARNNGENYAMLIKGELQDG